MENTPHVCLSCGEVLSGRRGKKFCDNRCRYSYHNELAAKGRYSSCVRNITNALLKNRKVLEGLLFKAGDNAKVSRERLSREGFQFKFFTHIYTTKANRTYFYCYDYGYLPIDEDWYLVVKGSKL